MVTLSISRLSAWMRLLRPAQRAHDPLPSSTGFPAQSMARIGQLHPQQPLVGRIPATAQQTIALQALEQRRHRAGVEAQTRGDLLHALPVLLPQRQHGEVLRIGETQRLKQRLVGGRERVGCGVDREAQLPVQRQDIRAGYGLIRLAQLWSGSEALGRALS